MTQFIQLFVFLISTLLTCQMHGMQDHSVTAKVPVPQGLPAIHNAAAVGNIQELSDIIHTGVDVNVPTDTHDTALHYAIFFQQDATVDYLLSAPNISVNASCTQGHTPLHVAAIRGSEHIIRALLSAGADLSATNAHDETPYEVAQRCNRAPEILMLLKPSPASQTIRAYRRDRKHDLEEGENPDQKKSRPQQVADDTALTALDRAIAAGEEVHVMQLLTDPSTAVNKRTGSSLLAPLHRAVIKNSPKITQMLLNAGATFDIKNIYEETPIQYAKKYDRSGSLKVLLNWQENHTAHETTPDESPMNTTHVQDSMNHDQLESSKLPVPETLRDLHKASAEGDIQKMAGFINCGANVNAFDNSNSTPLHYAVYFGQERAVDYLLSCPHIDVNIANILGFTPLHIAATCDSERAIQSLLNAGAQINAINARGETPFDRAQKSNRSSAILTLLNPSCAPAPLIENRLNRKHFLKNDEATCEEPHQKKSSSTTLTPKTVLDLTIEAGDEQQVAFLLTNSRTDINKKTGFADLSPLHRAVLKNMPSITQLLLNAGADIYAGNKYGETPIDYAKHYHRIGSLNVLLKWQKTHPQQEEELTPDEPSPSTNLFNILAHVAREEYDKTIDNCHTLAEPISENKLDQAQAPQTQHVEAERDHDAIYTLAPEEIQLEQEQNEHNSHTLAEPISEHTLDQAQAPQTHHAERPSFIVSIDKNDIDKIQHLLETHREMINEATPFGVTPLHRAVQRGNLKVTRLLVEHGANIIAMNNKRETPLDYAIKYDHQEILTFLQEWQTSHTIPEPKKSLSTTSKSPLYVAVEDRSKGRVKKLLADSNVDVNAQTCHGMTPLHKAVQKDSRPIVGLLLARGASLSLRDNYGRSALDLAKSNEMKDFLKTWHPEHQEPSAAPQQAVAINSPITQSRAFATEHQPFFPITANLVDQPPASTAPNS